jgi:hypothetical protein
MRDVERMADGLIATIRGYIDSRAETLGKAISSLAVRLDALPAPKDGTPGRDGRDGLPGLRGEPGTNGKDGLGFDDLAVDYDGERGFVLRFQRGAEVKEFGFTLPLVLDRGVWRERAYSKGDGVTWAGSFWIAQRDTEAKPDAGDSSWRLSVKRGRDGAAK